VPLKNYSKDFFYKGGIVYRGLMINSIFKMTFEELIDEFRKGGLSASINELTKRFNCRQIDLAGNLGGGMQKAGSITAVIHTTTKLTIAAEFSVKQSLGATANGNGYVLCFKINDHKGIYLADKPDMMWTDEHEVAIPGILLLEELLWIVEVTNFTPSRFWLNPINIEIVNKLYNNDTENEMQKICNIIRQNTLIYGNVLHGIEYLKSQSIEYSEYITDEDIKFYKEHPNTINEQKFLEKISTIHKKDIEKFIY